MNRRDKSFLPGRSTAYTDLKLLWTNWTAGCGALTLIMILSIFTPYEWLPVISAGCAILLQNRREKDCALTPEGSLTLPPVKMCVITLWLSAIVMLAILILCTPFLIGRVVFIPLYNEEIPFITSLIIFPVLALCCACQMLFFRKKPRIGEIPPGGVIANVVERETAYQIWMMFILSVVLGSIEGWYYFTTYINSNFNAPDHFFFVIMPLGIYLLSLFFMGGRYTSLSSLVTAVDNIHAAPSSTLIRFLIFSDNEILIRKNHFGLFDSPVEVLRDDNIQPDLDSVREIFSSMSGTTHFTLRYLYKNEALPANMLILHYAAILDESVDRDALPEKDHYRWVGLFDIQKLAAAGQISPVLASELVRIYAVTMAWKTYDREGRRLYPIRNYKPAFRFRDLASWTVDYDDSSWLDIAAFNEDTPFYRIRKLFRRRK